LQVSADLDKMRIFVHQWRKFLSLHLSHARDIPGQKSLNPLVLLGFTQLAFDFAQGNIDVKRIL